MRRLRHRESTTKIKLYSGYGGWKMKVDIAGSIPLVVLKKLFFFKLCILQNLEFIVLTPGTLQPTTNLSHLSQMVLGQITIKQFLRQI